MLAAALIGTIGVAGAFTFNACTFLPLLIALLLAIPNTPAPSRPKTASIYDDIREGLKFVWTSPGTRRLTIMGVIFMFLAAPLQGLLPVFAQSVLKGGPTLFGLDALSNRPGFDPGSIPAFLHSLLLPPPPPHPSGHVRLRCHRVAIQPLHRAGPKPDHPGSQRHVLVAEPESEQHRQSTTRHGCEPRPSPIHYASGPTRWDATRPSVRGLSNPFHVSAWVLRIMLGTLLVVMVVFLFMREPAIDNLPRRNSGKLTLRASIWEAVTAHSHHPAHPAETAVSSEKRDSPGSSNTKA